MRVHLIGIGGVGMRALAILLKQSGYCVSGSDVNNSNALEHLRKQGIIVHVGHHANHVMNADIVVRSTAIKEQNIEWQAAAGKVLMHRSDMLAKVFANKKIIAVAGAHGKTSTTAMIAHVLIAANFKPSFAIGSSWHNYPAGANLDSGAWAVIEADESDASFLKTHVDIALVLNIESEHMDFYQQSEQNLHLAYQKFMMQARSLLIYNKSDVRANKLAKAITNKLSFSVAPGSDCQLQSNSLHGYKFNYQNHLLEGDANVFGMHQHLNMAAAFLACNHIGVTNQQFVSAMSDFMLPGRRLEHLGKLASVPDTLVIDDYGHHPTELVASVSALRNKYPGRRLVHVFQPHRYTRLRDFFQGFLHALALADVLILLEVYAAGEEAIDGCSAQDILHELGQSERYYASSLNAAGTKLHELAASGDVILFQGAGDVSLLAHKVLGVLLDV